jgi:hypothetical protein
MKQKRPAKKQPIPAATPTPSKPYQPTDHDRATVQRVLDRRARVGPAPKFKIIATGNQATIAADHPEPGLAAFLLADSVGTGDPLFAEGLLLQLSHVARTGKELTTHDINTMLATVHAIGPRDATEALLASQMAAIHQATMTAARRLNHSETITQQDSASNMLTKLARTFTAQIEALKRYRSTGEQNVRVTHQYVNVNAHQAVVGINPGGGGTHENARQSHAPGETAATSAPDATSPALLGHEQTLPMPLPGAGREGPQRVPHARGASRSAEGQG